MPLLRTRSTVPGCVPGRDAQLALALERRDLELAAERGLRERDRAARRAMSSPTRRKKACGLTRIVELEVAERRDPGRARCRPDRRRASRRSRCRPGWSPRSVARLGDEARAAAGRARLARRSGRCRGTARTAARSRWGRPLLHPDAAAARCTRRSVSVVAPGAEPEPRAVRAGLDAVVLDLLRAAERGLFEGDLHLFVERASLADLDAERAEQVAEDAVDVEVATCRTACRRTDPRPAPRRRPSRRSRSDRTRRASAGRSGSGRRR